MPSVLPPWLAMITDEIFEKPSDRGYWARVTMGKRSRYMSREGIYVGKVK